MRVKTKIALFLVLIIIAGLVSVGVWFGKDMFKPKKTGWIDKGNSYNIDLQYIPKDETQTEDLERMVFEYDVSNNETDKALVELISSAEMENMEITFIYGDKLIDDEFVGEEYRDLILASKESMHIYMIIKVIDGTKEAYYRDSIKWRVRTKIDLTFDLGYGETIVHKLLLQTPISEDLIPVFTNNVIGCNLHGWFKDSEGTTVADLTKGFTKDVTVYAVCDYVKTSWLAYNSSQKCYYIVRGTETLPSELEIPALYDDGTHGVAPVTYINSMIINQKTYYDNGVFYNQTGLTSVKLPSSLTIISAYSFNGCSNLKSIELSENLDRINDNAFSFCSSLEGIHIPAKVKTIDPGAFVYCNLKWITVDPNNTVFDSRNNCNAIISKKDSTLRIGCSTTVIPTDITTIGASAFATVIRDAWTIPSNITTIGDRAFGVNHRLTSITIPATVTNIKGQLFSQCSNLVEIKVAAGNPKYDSRNNCNAIMETATNTLIQGCKRTVIPNTTKIIAAQAFYYQAGMTGSITIPANVTKIGQRAFRGTQLTQIHFASSTNWKYTTDSNYVNGVAIDVSDPEKNALYFTGESEEYNHFTYYWYKG